MSQVLPAVVVGVAAAGAAVLAWPTRRRPEWTPPPPWTGALPGRRGAAGPARAGWRRRRRPAVEGGGGLVPEALELVALALLGGASLATAVARAGAVLPGRTGEELSGVGARLLAGDPPEDAWRPAGDQWAPARRSLQLAEHAGVAPGQALVRAAEDVRRESVAGVEVAAARLGVRLVVPLGLAYLPAFVLTTVLPVVLALTRDLSW